LCRIRGLLRKIAPDILDAHFMQVNGYLGCISGFHPLVLTCPGSDILINSSESAVDRRLTKYSLKRADAIVCRSPVLKEAIVRLGARADKVNVILIGVDTDRFAPAKKDVEFRRRLGFLEAAPIVISTRNLKPVYDVETLVKAVPLVKKSVPEAKFVIAGEGDQRNYLGDLARSLSVAGDIEFTGPVPHDEMPGYLASADIYVSTSYSDGTSNCLLEGMASGLPAVVTDIPANRSWINEGENGALFPVKDHNILADKIVYMLKHHELRKRYGEINREIAIRRAEHRAEMEKLERLYAGLVAPQLQ
jgi:glycosyltransferase involved in cell wall biosynthesis